MYSGASLPRERSPQIDLPESRTSCWPTQFEFLLLQAGLLDLPKALAAWETFCDLILDIETLDAGCYRLFPLVAANLQSLGNKVPHGDRILGVLRYSWAKNQKLLSDLIPHLQALHGAGIEFLFLKGAALAHLYRELGSVRPMDDIDVLIHPHDLPRALALLGDRGCVPLSPVTPERITELLRFRHELTVQTPGGSTLDIHWYLLSDSSDFSAEDQLWKGAVPLELPGCSSRTLNTSDHLLHACLHGAQWNEVSPVRWLADTTVLIRTGVDWPRVEQQARLFRQVAPVRETVLFLETLGIEIPAPIVASWRAMQLSPIENLEQGFRSRRPTPRERTRQLVWIYLRMTRQLRGWEMIIRLPAFLRQIHHFRSYSRRIRFLGYLFLLLCQGKRQAL